MRQDGSRLLVPGLKPFHSINVICLERLAFWTGFFLPSLSRRKYGPTASDAFHVRARPCSFTTDVIEFSKYGNFSTASSFDIFTLISSRISRFMQHAHICGRAREMRFRVAVDSCAMTEDSNVVVAVRT